MKNSLIDVLAGIILMIIFFGIAFGGYFFKSFQEAKTFNRCTGASVSTWDAMFAEFRIEKCN